MFVYNQLQSIKAKNAYEQAESIASETTAATTEDTAESTTQAATEETTEEDTKPLVWQEAPIEDDDPFIAEFAEKNLDALREVNPDVLGWIEIPGTQLAYPIMDGDDNEYYLEHPWDKKASAAGSIFLERLNNSDLRDFNTLIYGHRMMNGSMFGSLTWTLKPNWYKNEDNLNIKLSTTNTNTVWRIFSIYTIKPEVYYLKTYFQSNEEHQEFLDKIKSRSIYNFNLKENLWKHTNK